MARQKAASYRGGVGIDASLFELMATDADLGVQNPASSVPLGTLPELTAGSPPQPLAQAEFYLAVGEEEATIDPISVWLSNALRLRQ